MFVWVAMAFVAVLVVVTALLPKGGSMRVHGEVPQAAEKIFAVLTDMTKAPTWLPNCESASALTGRDGPARRQQVHFKTAAGAVIADQQVTTWIAPRQYGWKQGPTAAYPGLEELRIVFTLSGTKDKTQVEILGDWAAAGFLSKWAVRFSMPKRMRGEFEQIVANLRSCC